MLEQQDESAMLLLKITNARCCGSLELGNTYSIAVKHCTIKEAGICRCTHDIKFEFRTLPSTATGYPYQTWIPQPMDTIDRTINEINRAHSDRVRKETMADRAACGRPLEPDPSKIVKKEGESVERQTMHAPVAAGNLKMIKDEPVMEQTEASKRKRGDGAGEDGIGKEVAEGDASVGGTGENKRRRREEYLAKPVCRLCSKRHSGDCKKPEAKMCDTCHQVHNSRVDCLPEDDQTHQQRMAVARSLAPVRRPPPPAHAPTGPRALARPQGTRPSSGGFRQHMAAPPVPGGPRASGNFQAAPGRGSAAPLPMPPQPTRFEIPSAETNRNFWGASLLPAQPQYYSTASRPVTPPRQDFAGDPEFEQARASRQTADRRLREVQRQRAIMEEDIARRQSEAELRAAKEELRRMQQAREDRGHQAYPPPYGPRRGSFDPGFGNGGEGGRGFGPRQHY